MMESSSKQPAFAAGRRPAQRGKADRALTPAELREYLAGLNAKDPNQLMGAVTQGSLVQGVVLATLAATALLLACTLGPYAWEKYASQPQLPAAAAKVAASPPQTDAQPAPADTAAAANSTAGNSAPAASANQPVVSKKVLGGIEEVKQSDPGVNPLDSKIDDLFDKTR
jgi:hypothetical protein